MKETQGDLWTYPADVRVITTNGYVDKTGRAVMGRGVALQAKERWPEFPLLLGRLLRVEGNKVYQINPFCAADEEQALVWTFPVKEHFRDMADLGLIERSALELVIAANAWQLLIEAPFTIVLPRPGCDSGRRHWSEVRPILRRILDDRFVVVHLGARS